MSYFPPIGIYIPKLYLKEIREFRGLTQQELADKFSSRGKGDVSFIQRLENGDLQPTLYVIGELCAFLFCSPNELFGYPGALERLYEHDGDEDRWLKRFREYDGEDDED